MSGPGAGNIQADPQFCGWDGGDAWVDASRPGPGTGAQLDPFSSLSSALDGSSLGLKQGSPCRGTGEDGADMGAAFAACAAEGVASRVVHLAPGTYSIAGFNLLNKVSLEGAGQAETVVEGTLRLRTGSVLSGLTVTGGNVGGIVVDVGQSPEIRDCAIVRNAGTGLVCNYLASPTLTNCLIAENGNNGVFCQARSAPTLINCTVSGNLQAGVQLIDSSPTLRNCIVTYYDHGAIATWGSSNPIVSYSCVENGWPGDGNIDQDPSFVQPGHIEDSDGDGQVDTWIPGDYRLRPGSPCIDTGICDGAPPLDIEGHVRPAGASCDMGAYEFDSVPPPPLLFRRGDTNRDAKPDMIDAVTTLGFLFLGKPETLACDKSADANDDGKIDLSDPVALLNHLFLGAPAPPPPFPDCGADGTADALSCESPRPCA